MIDGFIDKYKLDDLELIKIRGFVITRTIELESIIYDLIVSFLFEKGTNEELKIFNDFVIDLGNLQRNVILKSTLLRLGQSMSEVMSIIKDINDVNSLRNKLAHWDWSYISDDGKVTLTKGTSKRPNLTIGVNEIEEFCKTFDRVKDKLNIVYFKELVDSGRMPKKLIKGEDF